MIVYRHRRLDKNEIFYVGIGAKEKRAFVKSRTNRLWKNIVSKTEYEVEIIASDLNEVTAKELEVFLITQYGRINTKTGTLANLTDGGEGATGYITSEETKKLQSLLKKGKKTKPPTQEVKDKISFANKGSKNKMFGKVLGDHHNAKMVLDLTDGIYYTSLKEACNVKNLNYKVTSYFLTTAKVNKTSLIYV